MSERWLDTGEPAGADEPNALYEQMKFAIAKAKGQAQAVTGRTMEDADDEAEM